MSVSQPHDVARHLRIIKLFSIISWILTAVLVLISSFLPLFDSSPQTILPTTSSLPHRFAASLLRWDAFHFAHIARYGYAYEQQWAFFSGSPLMMHLASSLRLRLSLSSDVTLEDLLLGGMLAVASVGTATTLYHLTLHHTRSPSLAFVASLLSLLPSSPVTLRLAGYSEPFFAYLSYKGMLCCARSQWFRAACCFALAGAFRSTGFMLGGFILWGLLVDPFLCSQRTSASRVFYAAGLTAMVFIPFVAHQYAAYMVYCAGDIRPAPWCSAFPPSIYTYVQAKYWNSGLFLYWTPAQLPNFLISLPVLLLIFSYALHYIRRGLLPRLRTLGSQPPALQSALVAASLAPHVIHALVNALLLLFAAHTQIVLRVAATMPATYWAATWVVVEHPKWGTRWVTWSVLWGATSIVLWVTFLPPA